MIFKVLITLFLCLGLVCSVVAEDKNSHTIFKSGLHSLQFGFTGDFDNLTFASKKIIYKFHFLEASALRFGLEINKMNSEATNVFKYIYDDTTISNINTIDRETNYFQLEMLFIKYISYQRKVKGFLGGGLTYSKTKEKNVYPFYYDPYYPTNSETIIEIKSKGFKFVFGAEWFMNDYLSLMSEYGISYREGNYTYNYYYESSYRDEIREEDRDEKYFMTVTASFYICFYF